MESCRDSSGFRFVTLITAETRETVFRAELPIQCDMLISAFCSALEINTPAHVRLIWETVDELVPLNYRFMWPIKLRVVSVKDHLIHVYIQNDKQLTSLYCPKRSRTIEDVMSFISLTYPMFKGGRLLEMDEATPVLHREIKAGESVYIQALKREKLQSSVNWFGILFFIVLITIVIKRLIS